MARLRTKAVKKDRERKKVRSRPYETKLKTKRNQANGNRRIRKIVSADQLTAAAEDPMLAIIPTTRLAAARAKGLLPDDQMLEEVLDEDAPPPIQTRHRTYYPLRTPVVAKTPKVPTKTPNRAAAAKRQPCQRPKRYKEGPHVGCRTRAPDWVNRALIALKSPSVFEFSSFSGEVATRAPCKSEHDDSDADDDWTSDVADDKSTVSTSAEQRPSLLWPPNWLPWLLFRRRNLATEKPAERKRVTFLTRTKSKRGAASPNRKDES